MMKNSRKPMYRVILIFCIVMFLGCIGYLINLYKQPIMAEKEIEDLSESISETVTENGYNENAYPENCVAWLEIKDTKINYPIMQTEGAPEYYLRKNYKGEYSYSGTPFLDTHHLSTIKSMIKVLKGQVLKAQSIVELLNNDVNECDSEIKKLQQLKDNQNII